MKTFALLRTRACRSLAAFTIVLAVVASLSQTAAAATWNNIEPLKSRRADVERVLGKPLQDRSNADATLRFKVSGGMVTIFFVDAKFVATKKLLPELEGTVLQIVLQHENSSDTPESIGLPGKSDFQREESRQNVIYRNLKDGIFYTFLGGKLKATRYAPTADQLARARK